MSDIVSITYRRNSTFLTIDVRNGRSELRGHFLQYFENVGRQVSRSFDTIEQAMAHAEALLDLDTQFRYIKSGSDKSASALESRAAQLRRSARLDAEELVRQEWELLP